MSRLGLLVELKLAILANALRRLLRRSRAEFAVLVVVLGLAAGGLFFFFYESFSFFRGQEPFGPILIDEAFYLFNFAVFFMLVISSAVSAYTSLYQSREILFWVTRPVTWQDLYFMKLGEAVWYSSWSFLFIALPFMAAYGANKEVGAVLFPAVCLVFYVPFLVLAGTCGTLAAALVVWLLPNPRRRQIAFACAAALVTYFFARMQPQIIKEQGSLAGLITGYLPHVAFAKNEFLPSSWVTRGILAASNVQTLEMLGRREAAFYFLLVLSNTLFFLIPSAWAAGRIYPVSFLKAQDHGEARVLRRHARGSRWLEALLDFLPWPSLAARALLEKDLKSFFRDASEWSQIIIFFGLLLLYFANLRNLEFHVLKDFWRNLVFALNTTGTYVLLSSFNIRFVFPMLSLEGSRFWMIGMSPVRYSSLLLEKFLLGAVISMLLTLPLVFLSGWMLQIPRPSVLYALGLGFFVCVALTGMSVGFGAKFLNIRSNNPSEIISGFGGSMLLISHLLYITLVGAFLILSRQTPWITHGTMASISLLIASVPIKVGILALRKAEF